MKKEMLIKVLAGVVTVCAVGAGVFFLVSNGDSKNNTVVDKSNTSSGNSSKVNNTKSDFWLGTIDIPTKKKELSVKILDNVAGVPVDLTKFENSDYTFNYTIFSEYDKVSNGVGNYSVKTISEIKGSNFDHSGTKDIVIKNAAGETITTILAYPKCGEKKYSTYEEALRGGCWKMGLNMSKLFNREFPTSSNEAAQEEILELFKQLGKPSHIYTSKDAKLVIDGNGVGQLSTTINYDYGDFILEIHLLDTYNKGHDYRMLEAYGLDYVPASAYDISQSNYESFSKDIINELVK